MKAVYNIRALKVERRRLDALRRTAQSLGALDLVESFQLQVELVDARITWLIEHLDAAT